MAGEPYIDPAAQLGEGVRVGRFSVIGPRVRLGAGSVVADHCVVGEPATGAPLEIGPGALIRSFSDQPSTAGTYPVRWDGRDGSGRRVPSGIYFVQMEQNGITSSRKLSVLR